MAYDNNGRSQPTNRSSGTGRSRAGQARKAIRKPTKARLAISAVAGGGKTWSALSIAQVLAPNGHHLVIDTEKGDGEQGAAELYADMFDFETIQWDEPYDPRDLALTLRELYRPNADGVLSDVVILDSATHFWRGQGGTLDIAGGRFGGWKTATPAQDDLVEALLRGPWHLILCTRAKQDYSVEDVDGKQKVTKLGLAPIQSDTLEYEMQVAISMDRDHRIDISKTRCHTLAGRSFPANQQGVFAQIYKEWLDSGANLLRMADVAALRQAVKVHPDQATRTKVGKMFKDVFGLAEQIEADKLGDCWSFMAEQLRMPPHPFLSGDDPSVCERCSVSQRAGWHRGVLIIPDDVTASDGDPDEFMAELSRHLVAPVPVPQTTDVGTEPGDGAEPTPTQDQAESGRTEAQETLLGGTA